MRVVALYHPNSEHSGAVQDYAAEFERYKLKKVDLVSLETIEGADMASLYGVSVYPTFMVMSNDGSLLRLWQGAPPLMDELSYYVHDDHPLIERPVHSIMPVRV